MSADLPVLYETDYGAALTRRDFLEALNDVGVQAGDVCFFHTSLLAFGRAQTEATRLANELSRVLMDSVSPGGTLILPTFSYSFCRNEVFDVDQTPSSVGALNEYFRKQQGVMRTTHPIFSCAIWGNQRDALANVEDDCFGKESIFGKLHALNGKIVFLGIGLETCTFIHYVEQCHGVPYRFLKTFSGTVVERGVARQRECSYLVRYLDANVVLSLERLETKLRERGYLRDSALGHGRILAVDAGDFYRTAWEMLDADIFSLLRRPPNLKSRS